MLDADISRCFDTIDHNKLLNKLQTTPKIQRQVESWLKAGILDRENLEASTVGTPQGGVISPLLSNIALHGAENYLNAWIINQKILNMKGIKLQSKGLVSGLNFIRYADDFVILHKDYKIVRLN